VGSKVGTADGTAEGVKVGSKLGTADGTAEGVKVGSKLGTAFKVVVHLLLALVVILSHWCCKT
jgi:hypothetical protein